MYRFPRLVIASACGLTAILFSSCLQTSLLYDMNTYHDGRTLGKNQASAQLRFTEAPAFETNENNGELEKDFHEFGFCSGLGARFGVSDRCDLGGVLELGLTDNGASTGGRIYTKVRLNDTSEKLAFSIMPGIGYTHGYTDRDDDLGTSLSSSIWAFEMHVPMSYEINQRFRWTFGAQAFYFLYRAPFEGSDSDPLLRSVTLTDELFCPAISGGFQYGVLHPEITVAVIDGKARAVAGLGFNFK